MSTPSVPDRPLNLVGYYDLAHEICARVNHDGRKLTDDERIVISVVAAQAALAKHADPTDEKAEATLNKLVRVLNHNEMISAMTRKMQRLLEQSEQQVLGKPSVLEQLARL